MVDTEEFSHHGMHAENDNRQAAMTLMLLWFFATAAVILIILAVRAA